jgi:hypothetical protein
MGRIFLDSFSGGAALLPKRQHKDAGAVLQALVRDPNVSTFDRSELPALNRTLIDLEARKLVEQLPAGYPWHKYRITPEGSKFLDDLNNGAANERKFA